MSDPAPPPVGPSSLSGARVWVAGHRGLVGRAFVRRLEREAPAELIVASSEELDLRRQEPTERFVRDTRPDIIMLAAARVGGIEANRTAQGSQLYDNLMIAANVLEAARAAEVARVLVLGSSCAYPREAHQPIREEELLAGPLEPTNEGYAVAKIAGLELAKMYRRQYGLPAVSLMPCNLYGPHDNFDPRTSHVLPALLRKIHEARTADQREVTIWGSGEPRREFLHVDDLADAAVHVLERYDDESPLNVGAGVDITIRELAEVIADVVGWEGEFVYDTSMPDGVPRKLLDTSRLATLGWEPRIGLRDGIVATHRWYRSHAA